MDNSRFRFCFWVVLAKLVINIWMINLYFMYACMHYHPTGWSVGLWVSWVGVQQERGADEHCCWYINWYECVWMSILIRIIFHLRVSAWRNKLVR